MKKKSESSTQFADELDPLQAMETMQQGLEQLLAETTDSARQSELQNWLLRTQLDEQRMRLTDELMREQDPEHHRFAILDPNDPRVIEMNRLDEQMHALTPQYETHAGYVDRTGRLVLDLQYERAGRFVEGLAPVVYQGRPGYIDRSGKLVIELPQHADPAPFSEGLAAVWLHDHNGNGLHCGYIDRTGKFAIEPRPMHGRDFSNGLAFACIFYLPDRDQIMKLIEVGDWVQVAQMREHKNEYAYIDQCGGIVLKMKKNWLGGGRNDDPQRYAEGLIRAKRRSKFGFIDLSGKFVIQPRFTDVGAFSEGLARVELNGEKGHGKLAFIDRTGAIAIPTNFNTDGDFERNSTDFSEGWASLTEGLQPNVLKKECQWVYIDKTGQIVLETDFFYAGCFHEGVAAVYDSEQNKWGSIDKSGQLVAQLVYDSVGSCSEGLVDVSVTKEVPPSQRTPWQQPSVAADSQRAITLVQSSYHAEDFDSR